MKHYLDQSVIRDMDVRDLRYLQGMAGQSKRGVTLDYVQQSRHADRRIISEPDVQFFFFNFSPFALRDNWTKRQ